MFDKNISPQGIRTRRFASASLTVTLVISACRESLSFLTQKIAEELRKKLKVVVVMKCGDESERWLWIPPLFFEVEFLQIDDGAVRGDECTAYLGYIVERYMQISNYTLGIVFIFEFAFHFESVFCNLKF